MLTFGVVANLILFFRRSLLMESLWHRKLKNKEPGEKEKVVHRGAGKRGRLDSASNKRAIEIERGGKKQIEKSIINLLASRKETKILRAPQKNMALAKQVAKRVLNKSKSKGAKIRITNLSKTKCTYVEKKKRKRRKK